MNANELADDLGKALAEILKLQDQVRQQQAEIEALKELNEKLNLTLKALAQQPPQVSQIAPLPKGVVW